MSDIGLNLSGIIALFVFLIVSGAMALFGLVSLVFAFVKASKTGMPAKKQGAFAFFVAAVPLLVVNLLAFGILVYTVDSNARETNEFIDKAVLFAWLPLQPIIWIVGGMTINKLKK